MLQKESIGRNLPHGVGLVRVAKIDLVTILIVIFDGIAQLIILIIN